MADTTPLDPAAEPGPRPQERPGHTRRGLYLVLGIAGVVLLLDQLTKAWAVRTLDGSRRDVLGSLFGFRLTRNAGAAFSTGTGATWVFTVLAVVVAVAIVRIARRLASPLWGVALGLLLGGALGNLSDRLLRAPGPGRGHVVDFLELPHWPVFNLADSAICCAAALIVLASLLGVGIDGRPGPVNQAEDHRALPVPDGLAGERVDAGLARLFGLSRSTAADLAAGGMVLVDGEVAAKSTRLRPGAWLEVTLPPLRTAAASAAAAAGAGVAERVPGLRVVLEDDNIVVVDKPVGVAAHPSPGWSGPTVVGGLAAAGHRIATSGAPERQGVVHRLDVGTSGLMVVAKSERAYSVLKQAFRERTVDKTYHALVQGHPDPSAGTIDAPIGRHPVHDHRWAVTAGGRDSVTHYSTLEAFPAASLLEVHLETGRTHQIRVHFSALRHPCAGDLTYGADPALAARLGLTRQWLHAVRLGFAHPADGHRVEVASDYPPDLAEALRRLRA